ncbi:hypothetical protein CRG98_034544 [Punica granatum]|uniref:Uncharacterized protein n=1 Tax=Punica granatum TaxID=22663 RepID=A0A2I0IM59_PUNGR|nr:hypothetical protein CRG98_034544 [Punica granatum]
MYICTKSGRYDVREGVGAANWQPRALHRGRRRSPWWIRDRGHQSTTLTPPSRASAFSMGVGALGGGVRVADWQPRPRIDRGPRLGSGLPIGDHDPSTEVAGVLCGCRRPRWRIWGCQLAAQPSPPSIFLYRTKMK